MRELFKIYSAALTGFRWRSFWAVVLSGFSGLLEGTALLALVPALDSVLGGGPHSPRDPSWLERWGVPGEMILPASLTVFTIIGLSSAAVRLLSDGIMLGLRVRVEEMIRKRMTSALFAMDWTAYLSHRLGDLSKSMLLEGLQIGMGVRAFLQAIGLGIIVVIYFGIALSISLKMTMATMVFATLGGLAYIVVSRRTTKHAKALSRAGARIGDEIAETFGNFKFLRSTGLSEAARKKAETAYGFYRKTYFWSHIYNNILRFCFEGGGILFITVFLIISVLVIEERGSHAVVFLAVFYRLMPRIMTVHSSLHQARMQMPWYVDWEKRYHSTISHAETCPGRTEPQFKNMLEFQSVAFSYPKAKSPALKGISWQLRRGECVALVGESGSGKSTIVDLVTCLLRPQFGTILLDGMPLEAVDPELLRDRIGLVMQESPTFHTTTLENIAWGYSEPDLKKAEHVARMAHAWDFIQDQSEGLESVVGEKGGRLSGGQRQRLALARALYRDPWLLILDEATSALDGESEAIVQKALEGIKGSCSILLVAHRLKTVQMADHILVLDKGEIVERGSWTELLERKDGMFRKMAALQGLTKEDQWV